MEAPNFQNLEYCIDGFPPFPGKVYKIFSLTRDQFTAACLQLSDIEFGHSPDQTIRAFKDIDKELAENDDGLMKLPNFGVGVNDKNGSQTRYFWSLSHDTILCHAIEWKDGEVVSESFDVKLPPGKVFGKTDDLLSSIQKGN